MTMKNMQWLVVTAAVVGILVQLLKTDKFDSLLMRFGLPPLPRKALPWVALCLGLVSGVIQLYLNPSSDIGSMVGDIVTGILSGAAPIAAHELATNREGSVRQ